MRLTIKKLRESIRKILHEEYEKKPVSTMPPKGSSRWPNSIKSSSDDVEVPARIMKSLTDEEFAAFNDQMQQRTLKSRQPSKLEKIKQKPKDDTVQVPVSVLQSLDEEEYEAYVQQLMKHGDTPEPRVADDEYDMLDSISAYDMSDPNSTSVTGAIRRKKLGLK